MFRKISIIGIGMFFIVSIIFMVLASPAFATDRSWDSGGGANNNWSTAANWSSDVEPGPSDNAYISNGGTALITQGETVNYVNLAQSGGTTGNLNITGGSLSAVSFDPGYLGTSTVTQSAGTVSASQWLTLSWGIGSNTTYNLSGGTVQHTYVGGEGYGMSIGWQGTAVFNHTGGNLTLGNNLYLGGNSSGNGTYNLSGTGVLNTPRLILGDGGLCAVNQTGGTATISSRLYMGRNAGGNATYNLSGGTLSVASFEPNAGGTSNININGGTLTGAWTTLPVDNFRVASVNSSTGSFALESGKTLQASWLETGGGTGSTGTLNLNGGNVSATYLDTGGYGNGTVNQSGGTVTIDTSFTTAVQVGSQGTYNLSGGTLNYNGTGAALGYQGAGTINQTGGTYNGATWITLGNTATASGALYLSENGIFNTAGLTVGYLGTNNHVTQTGGTLNQTGNVGSGYSLNIGNQPGVAGVYSLSGGAMNSQTLIVGHLGNGTLTQTGGTATVSNYLGIAGNSGAVGTYNLNGGALNVASFSGNGAGTSTFNIDGGTLTGAWTTLAADNLNIGNASGKTGSYTLANGKSFTATTEYIGKDGTGTLTQSGGTNTVTNIYIAANPGSIGTYNFNGGYLKAGAIQIGSGTGAFNFNGGKLSVGTYTGALNVQNGATISPGDSPGTQVQNGNITFLSGSTLDMEIGGLTQGTQYDWLDVNGGNVTFQSGSILKLTQWNSYTPNTDDYFDIITWDNGYTFTNNGFSFQPWDANFTFKIVGNAFRVTYNDTTVPEPATVVGMLSGLLLLSFRRVLRMGEPRKMKKMKKGIRN